jgi:hypothetical protein
MTDISVFQGKVEPEFGRVEDNDDNDDGSAPARGETFRMKLIRVAVMTAVAMAMYPVLAHAVTQDNFPPKTTRDLVALCTADKTDPLGTAALNFCHGYFRGAIDLEEAYAAAERRPVRFFCLPTSRPSFDEGRKGLPQWAASHQDQMSAAPIDGLFRFLGDTFPCRPGEQQMRPKKQ